MVVARVVYVAQLIVPFLAPWLFFPGRTGVGAPSGWLSTVGLLTLGPPLTIALCLPVLVSLRDRRARAARAAGGAYTGAMLVTWAGLLVAALFVTEDSVTPPMSLVGAWTDGALDPVASQYIFFVAIVIAVGGWASALWFAVSGYLDSRRVA